RGISYRPYDDFPGSDRDYWSITVGAMLNYALTSKASLSTGDLPLRRPHHAEPLHVHLGLPGPRDADTET
ncbi:MAG: hypothetical protein ACJAT3_001790, partial [Akkermansiaceae bacterium]